jgi:hypothetical protein
MDGVAVRRWRTWMVYACLAIVPGPLAVFWLTVAGFEVGNTATLEVFLGKALAAAPRLLGAGALGAVAMTLALLPAALGTLLWERRWGHVRLHVNGDAFGAAVAAACMLILIIPVGAVAAVLTFPLFMTTRLFARARVDGSAEARATGGVILLLIVAQVVTVGILLLLPGRPAAVLVWVPLGLATVAIGLQVKSWRDGRVVRRLALHAPSSSRAWLVALLPALVLVIALLLNRSLVYSIETVWLMAFAVTTELVFRGFAFLRLREAGARFVVAAVVPGIIAVAPFILFISPDTVWPAFVGLLAQAIWLAWLVERWNSTWVAIVSAALLAVAWDNFVTLPQGTRVWFELGLRLWIIGMSVALTQTLQRRSPVVGTG